MADARGNAIADNKDDRIKLKVVGLIEVHYLQKPDTSLGRLKSAFAERVGVPVTALCYFYKNRRVDDMDTPRSLQQTDGDTIEVIESGPPKVVDRVGNTGCRLRYKVARFNRFLQEFGFLDEYCQYTYHNNGSNADFVKLTHVREKWIQFNATVPCACDQLTVKYKPRSGVILSATYAAATMTFLDFRQTFNIPRNLLEGILVFKERENEWRVIRDDKWALPVINGHVEGMIWRED